MLLPPSETKLAGGDITSALDLERLSYPALSDVRAAALDATEALSGNFDAMAVALKLGPTQHFELQRNREIPRSP